MMQLQSEVARRLAGPTGLQSNMEYHYCPEFSERTPRNYLIYNGFSAILGGVGLKLAAVSPTLPQGGPAHERRKDAVLAADGLPALEHVRTNRRALSW
jgi:hypothetical protein